MGSLKVSHHVSTIIGVVKVVMVLVVVGNVTYKQYDSRKMNEFAGQIIIFGIV